jgi:hypothetical protein
MNQVEMSIAVYLGWESEDVVVSGKFGGGEE